MPSSAPPYRAPSPNPTATACPASIVATQAAALAFAPSIEHLQRLCYPSVDVVT
ncbi:hypothetical protein VKT23_013644 [Stygiomarasmius scandens]|uniref:Uncharacterized protein n=1 Tax=Marasmiellus scandens TaxID=2682957 RepID=A0ABR1J5K4_9AGAR